MQKYIKNGQARLFKGDALKADTVKAGWEEAMKAGSGTVDLVLFTVGVYSLTSHAQRSNTTDMALTGGAGSFSLKHGAVLDPPDICTRSLRNVICTLPPTLRAPERQPRFVVITSYGCTAESRATVPLAVLPLYSYAIRGPHADKVGVERILSRGAGLPWSDKDTVQEGILPAGWESEEGMVGAGELTKVVIVRPALLMDGKCHGDETGKKKGPYRICVGGDLDSAYRISRQDVGHFIAEDLVGNWSKYENKPVCIAY